MEKLYIDFMAYRKEYPLSPARFAYLQAKQPIQEEIEIAWDHKNGPAIGTFTFDGFEFSVESELDPDQFHVHGDSETVDFESEYRYYRLRGMAKHDARLCANGAIKLQKDHADRLENGFLAYFAFTVNLLDPLSDDELVSGSLCGVELLSLEDPYALEIVRELADECIHTMLSGS